MGRNRAHLKIVPDAVTNVEAPKIARPPTPWRFSLFLCSIITKSARRGGTLVFTFTRLDSDGAGGRNWTRKAVKTRPDGATETTYYNDGNQPLLKVLSKNGESWPEYFEYNSENRQTLHATASAIDSFSEPASASENFTVTLKTDAGLIENRAWYPESGGGAGSAPEYLQSTSVQEGENGSPVKQQDLTYTSHSENGQTVYRVEDRTIYQSDSGGGSDPATTSFDYAWRAGTLEVEELTEKPPIVPVSQNGDGQQHERVTVYDEFGNPQWIKNERGYIDYRVYDRLTGAQKLGIEDVDTEPPPTRGDAR